MARRPSIGGVGRKLLLSAAMGTLPLAGCTGYPGSMAVGSPNVIRVTPAEKALYDEARSTADPAVVSRFLAAYPGSRLIPGLLSSLPPSVLQRVSRAAVAGVDPAVLDDVPASILQQLNVASAAAPPPPPPTTSVRPGGGDGYAG